MKHTQNLSFNLMFLACLTNQWRSEQKCLLKSFFFWSKQQKLKICWISLLNIILHDEKMKRLINQSIWWISTWNFPSLSLTLRHLCFVFSDIYDLFYIKLLICRNVQNWNLNWNKVLKMFFGYFLWKKTCCGNKITQNLKFLIF